MSGSHIPPNNIGELQIYRGYELADLAIFSEFTASNRTGQEGFAVNFLGAKTRLSSLSDAWKHLDGSVEQLPIPSDYHAEAVEWIGLLKSAKTASGAYIAMEWGAGWAPWLIAGATAARLKGINKLKLYGVEADPHHFEAMCRNFIDNDLPPHEHVLLQAAVGAKTGTVQWPKEIDPNNVWGARPIRTGTEGESDKAYLMGRVDEFFDVEILSAVNLLREETLWDMLHIDIQGWEEEVCRSCIDLINERVKWVIIGTHSRVLEGKILELFHTARWHLEHEKPVRFRYISGCPNIEAMTLVDGTQVWRNPRFGR